MVGTSKFRFLKWPLMKYDDFWWLMVMRAMKGSESRARWVFSLASKAKSPITRPGGRLALSRPGWEKLGHPKGQMGWSFQTIHVSSCFIMFHHIVQAFLGWCFPFFCNISQLTSIFRQTTNQQSLRSFWVLPCPGEHQQDTGFRPGHLSSGSLWLSTASYTKSPNHISSVRNPCWLMIAGLYYPIYCGL